MSCGRPLGEGGVVEPELPRPGRTVVVHQDVGGGQQIVERGAVVGLLEVEDDAALAAHPRVEARTGADGGSRGRLDRDDVGAGLGQQQRRHRAGDAVGEVDDPDAVEDAGVVHRRVGCHHRSPCVRRRRT